MGFRPTLATQQDVIKTSQPKYLIFVIITGRYFIKQPKSTIQFFITPKSQWLLYFCFGEIRCQTVFALLTFDPLVSAPLPEYWDYRSVLYLVDFIYIRLLCDPCLGNCSYVHLDIYIISYPLNNSPTTCLTKVEPLLTLVWVV